MANITFASLVSEILPEVPGCTDTLVIRALRRTAEQYLTDSQEWRVTLDEQPLIAGMSEYDVEVPYSYTKAVRIIWAEVDGKRISQVSDGQQVRSDSNIYCHLDGYGKTVIVKPEPTQAAKLQLRVALSILPNTAALTDTVIYGMYDPLLHGALARLQMMSGQEWSNPQAGAQNEMLFREAVAKARGHANNNGGSAVRKMRYGGI